MKRLRKGEDQETEDRKEETGGMISRANEEEAVYRAQGRRCGSSSK